MFKLIADEGFQTIITTHASREAARELANASYAVPVRAWRGDRAERDGMTFTIEEEGRPASVYRYVVEVEVPADLPPRVRANLADAERLGTLVTRCLTGDQQLPWGLRATVSRVAQ